MTQTKSTEKADRAREAIVAPPNPSSEQERDYWDQYEALVQDYYRQKSSAYSDEGRYGLYCLGTWPLSHVMWDDNWPPDWHYRFDVQTLELLHGSELLIEEILEPGIMEGYDAKAIVDEIESFIEWLGQTGRLPNALTERLGNEIAKAKPSCLKAFAEADTNEDRNTDYEIVAAPFVYWLRTEIGWPLEKLLLGQSLCIDALKLLGSRSVEEARWESLNIESCMQYTARQLPCLDLAVSNLRDTTDKFLDWLSRRGLLHLYDRRRLLRRAKRVFINAHAWD
ncbi:MAG: hypothetical protein JXA30_02440 [Deltaproteobacteria bacterium]|nr:hypothetical protein [Deltaproteobacteria bacterium]